jgi:hypothetical protein
MCKFENLKMRIPVANYQQAITGIKLYAIAFREICVSFLQSGLSNSYLMA